MRSKMVVLGVLLEALGIFGLILPSPLFGLFEVNAGVCLAHIASGSLAIVSAFRGVGAMRLCGKILGFGYLALAIIGFAAPDYDIFEYVAFQTPANTLHLVVAAVFLYVAFLAPPN
ncbi:MAG: DUF4383 domain-containing protein [Acidobacteria bacterium]|nr:DUF4383 domain-containing protein [Acidobacteriota bacterium]